MANLNHTSQQKSTVLIVDDEEPGRDTLEALLLPQGYHLILAENGKEALEKATEFMPDLVLLDIMMPIMDGFEVCRQMRANPLLAEVPIIMVTALNDRASKLKGIEAGADDFLSKPFDRFELQARIKTVIRLNRYRRLHQERLKFEWAVEQSEDGYLIINEQNQILYTNSQARLYLGILATNVNYIAESFLDLASKQYQCEPKDAWAVWAENFEIDLKSPYYLIKPESKAADAFWLRVDLLEISPLPTKEYLIRLHNITANIIVTRLMWSFHMQTSHKLKTPLTILTGYLDVLMESQTMFSADEQQSLIAAAHEKSHELKEKILEIFKYLEVPEIIKPTQSQLSVSSVSGVINTIGTHLDLASISFSYENIEDPTQTYLPISRYAFETIIQELLENAKKFHPNQTPTLEIKISNQINAIQIQICDDGLTLSPEQLKQIWQAYYQAERTFTGQVPGMGLGLSNVSALVWGVGGSCRAYNRQDGPGVIMEITFPLANQD